MRIQIDGTNTLNKGAELMLYAILQEIEQMYPDAEVVYNRIGENSSYIQTKLNFKTRCFAKDIIPFSYKFKIPGILRKLSIPCSFLTPQYLVSGVDIVLDAGGFQFSDQIKISDYDLLLWEQYYRKLKLQGTKIVLLPQAFGPLESSYGRKIATVISKYADIIFARETVSYNYLLSAGVAQEKIKLYPDFTALVEGIVLKQYESLKGGVCIIPNLRMVDKGAIAEEDYLLLMIRIINTIEEKNGTPFLLNHEGKGDALLCEKINRQLKNPVPFVNNLTALEIKGVIAQSYAVISSRFHGVASALSSSVPCLATSWSHKYKELFKDYEQYNCLLSLNSVDEILEKVSDFLSIEIHNNISKELKEIAPMILAKNKEMWNIVWDACNMKN